ncbi:MAG: GH3 auxin-responsive promoter family protein [Bacteroidales bacterium]|nr:GH3 auxin-responsive promoter family protein [Bacteroidales bacterium]
MNITPLVRQVFKHRARIIDSFAHRAEELQRQVLARLLHQARHTLWGEQHNYVRLNSYEDFAQQVPLNDYETLKAHIDRMRHGERDILWPGQVRWYAKSSGTTNDKSKFIPISQQGLQQLHYAGGRDVMAIYLRNRPDARVFSGKGLILGGSHQPNYDSQHSRVGDLSAILNENASPFVRLFRATSKETALLEDFELKRERIARETMHKNVTSISGVPSWMMAVLNKLLEITGATTVDEVWPNLEVFFHGGVAFTPYREQYLRMIPSARMQYMETFNASEGFFGLQTDPQDKSMELMMDYDVFYEFIPLEEVGSELPTVLPVWEVEVGKNYALVITTSCGLWRYQIGDTLKFTSVRPYKFIISGRTKSFINAFGEELMVDNAEQGLKAACEQCNAEVSEYTAAPVFMDAEGKCRHQWVVEFRKRPADVEAFAQALDAALQSINSDYEAKRYKDITLQRLEIVEAREGLFNDWLASRGKLGGQHKVPRLSNHRDIIEQILALQ